MAILQSAREELRGKRFGIQNMGSSTWMHTMLALWLEMTAEILSAACAIISIKALTKLK